MTERSLKMAVTGGVVRVHVSAATDSGQVHADNQDSIVVEPPLFAVADGMGGHEGGQQASELVTRTLAESVSAENGGPTTTEALMAAIAEANARVFMGNKSALSERGRSGTTLAGIALVDDAEGVAWLTFNIGDSRVYRFNGRFLVRVTVDHSFVQELVSTGSLRSVDAEHHPYRNVVTRVIGPDDTVKADMWRVTAASSQAFLICSDGLTKEVEDSEIARMFTDAVKNGTTEGLADRLVGLANERGARDNVSVIVVTAASDLPDDGSAAPEVRRVDDAENATGVEDQPV